MALALVKVKDKVKAEEEVVEQVEVLVALVLVEDLLESQNQPKGSQKKQTYRELLLQ